MRDVTCHENLCQSKAGGRIMSLSRCFIVATYDEKCPKQLPLPDICEKKCFCPLSCVQVSILEFAKHDRPFIDLS